MLKESGDKFFLLSFVLIILISLIFLFPSFSLSLDNDDWISISACRFSDPVCGFFKPYGLQVWFFGSLYDFWGFNLSFYYILAFIFRSLAAFSILLLVFHLTRNKLAAFLSGLFFAITFTGIQTTFEPTNMIVYLAIIGCMIFLYFFFLTRDKLSLLNFTALNVSLFVTTILSPVRMSPLYIWQFMIDILWFIISPTKSKLKNLFIRQTGIIALFIFLKSLGTFQFGEGQEDAFVNAAKLSLSHIFQQLKNGDLSVFSNILIGLGNVIFPSRGNFIIDIFGPNLNLTIGALYIVFLITLLGLVLKRKTAAFLMLFNFLLWPFIFYLSFWVVSLTANSELIIQSFRRYLLPLFVAITINLGLSLALTKNKFKTWHNIFISITVFLLLVHGFSLFGYLKDLSVYRNGPYVKQFWQQIKAQVPKLPTKEGQVNVFYFEFDESIPANVSFNKFNYAVHNDFPRIAAIIYNIPQNSPHPPNPRFSDSFEELVSYVKDGSPFVKHGLKVEPVPWERIFAFRLEEDRIVDIKEIVKKRAEKILNQVKE